MVGDGEDPGDSLLRYPVACCLLRWQREKAASSIFPSASPLLAQMAAGGASMSAGVEGSAAAAAAQAARWYP